MEWSSTREIPSLPSTNASESIHASATAYDASSSRPHEATAAYRGNQARPTSPTSSAGAVPGPTSLGSQKPCSGGEAHGFAERLARLQVCQSKMAGSANASTTSSSVSTRPVRAARAGDASAAPGEDMARP